MPPSPNVDRLFRPKELENSLDLPGHELLSAEPQVFAFIQVGEEFRGYLGRGHVYHPFSFAIDLMDRESWRGRCNQDCEVLDRDQPTPRLCQSPAKGRFVN